MGQGTIILQPTESESSRTKYDDNEMFAELAMHSFFNFLKN